MTIIPKAFVGAVAAGAMVVVPTAAASAQSRYGNDRGGISAGEVIAGAVIIGGIAAIAASIGNNNRNDDRYYRNGSAGYYNGNPRAAVEQCVNAANRDARSRGYRSAQVTQVRDVDDTRQGWKIKGNLQVDSNGGYYSNTRYDSRSNNGRYNNSNAYRADSGSFTCWIDGGRVSKMDYSSIRGM